MNQEFNPANLSGDMEMTPEERLAFNQLEEKRIGDENEAKGLNRDGSLKVEVSTPVVPESQKTAPQGPVDLAEIRNSSLGAGMRDAPSAGTSLSTEALIVKEKLSKQPKLPIFLPLASGERKGIAYRPVLINGYRFEVKKGMMVNVPEAVHSLLINAMQATAEATEVDENLSNADGAKRRALGLE